ncbi:MAG: NAD(P)H-dependent oxidoreductase [Nitrospirae bacterium]|nr:NAD(P)H-dependent oxidoreductase [Nitrospirota bacterium]
MKKPRILVNLFHPDIKKSRGNIKLINSISDIKGITIRDIYALYPDFKIDVKKEQEILVNHDLLVFQHPFYWYSCPSMFKEWQDRVLEQGFAFPPGVGDALKGKHWLSVITTGGAQEAYRSGGFNNYSMSELLKPFQQTANLCGLKWLPPFIIHGVLPPGIVGYKIISDPEIIELAKDYRKFIEDYQM